MLSCVLFFVSWGAFLNQSLNRLQLSSRIIPNNPCSSLIIPNKGRSSAVKNFAAVFFLCGLGCFFDLGFGSSAGCVPKRLEKVGKGWKRLEKYKKVQKVREKYGKRIQDKPVCPKWNWEEPAYKTQPNFHHSNPLTGTCKRKLIKGTHFFVFDGNVYYLSFYLLKARSG